MGCINSFHLVCRSPKQPSPPFAQHLLNSEQKVIVKYFWRNVICPKLAECGVKVFLRIFEMRPDFQNLFSFRSLSIEELPECKPFRNHALKFMQAVGCAVENIDDMTETKNHINSLGRIHVSIHGFQPAHWDTFTRSLLYVLELELGQFWNESVKQAWFLTIDFMIDEMKSGYMEERFLRNSSTTPSGDRNKHRRSTQRDSIKSLS